MIEQFHHSLKSFFRARLAGSDWAAHLLLLMLSLRASPKDDSGLSPAEAVYGSALSLPGEFFKHSELLPESFLRNFEKAVLDFSGPPRHHAIPQPQPLPRVLQYAEFVFVRDDALNPPLSPSTEDPTEFFKDQRNFLFFRLETNQVQFLCD